MHEGSRGTHEHNSATLNLIPFPQIQNSDDFEWTRQLRYNFDDIRDTVMIRQNNSVFEYGFEYLGSTSRLVVTPLTGTVTW